MTLIYTLLLLGYLFYYCREVALEWLLRKEEEEGKKKKRACEEDGCGGSWLTGEMTRVDRDGGGSSFLNREARSKVVSMEGSESEAIFESFNLKPQLFINESLNIVDELVDGAFHHFHLEASKLLKTDGTDRSEDLQKGIDYIQNTIQASLDKRLVMWEQYCLHHCFTVPTGFSLPSGDEASSDDLMDQDDPNDEQVEAQLDNLRNKLAEAGKECSELKKELRELERKSTMSNQYISSVNEALQLYEESSAHDMFQDMMNVASELRHKMEQLKSKEMKEIERSRRERANDANGDIPELRYSKGLSKLGLDDLQEFMTKMNSEFQ